MARSLESQDIYAFIAHTQGESLLAEEIERSRRIRDRDGFPVSKPVMLAHLFLEYGRNGIQAVKEGYFKDVDMYADTFMDTSQFTEMPQEAQSAFLDNYAAILIGISILSVHESFLSDGQTFLRERFMQWHNEICDNVFVKLTQFGLPMVNISLYGKEEMLTGEQWNTMQKYATLPFGILNEENRSNLPKTLQIFLERNPRILQHIDRMYKLFRAREEQLSQRHKVPLVFDDSLPEYCKRNDWNFDSSDLG